MHPFIVRLTVFVNGCSRYGSGSQSPRYVLAGRRIPRQWEHTPQLLSIVSTFMHERSEELNQEITEQSSPQQL